MSARRPWRREKAAEQTDDTQVESQAQCVARSKHRRVSPRVDEEIDVTNNALRGDGNPGSDERAESPRRSKNWKLSVLRRPASPAGEAGNDAASWGGESEASM